MTDAEVPFIRAILRTPRSFALRLKYTDWLEERGDIRAEYIRTWVTANDPAKTGQSPDRTAERLLQLHNQLNRHWAGFIECWRAREEVDPKIEVIPGEVRTNDAELGLGPCTICGRSQDMVRWVSRLPCESCNRVFCWECADTGIYGSLADFRHFFADMDGRWRGYLGSDSCPICQETDWMRSHRG
jgi:uncharacterized protein (TIGR02996 family)